MHPIWRRVVSVVSTATLLLGGFAGFVPPQSALAAAPSAPSPHSAQGSAAGGGTPGHAGVGRGLPVGSVVGRTAHSTTTVGTGDSLVATVSAQPVNYRDASGNFIPIDNTLVAAPAGSGEAWQNRANSYTAQLPAHLGDAPVRLRFGSGTIAFQLLGLGSAAGNSAGASAASTVTSAAYGAVADVAGTPSGASDTFAGVLPGVNVTYTATNEGLKEDVVLTSSAAPSTFTYTLQVGGGLVPQANAQGGIDFVDHSGQVQATMPSPVMSDAAGARGQVGLTLGGAPGHATLTLTADAAWLQDPARRYPVTIDPSVVTPIISGDTRDCYLVSGTGANTSYCGGADLDVGFDGSSAYRALVYYDLAGVLPAQSQVLNAQFILTQATRTTANPSSIDLDRLTQAWTAAATWNTTDGTTAWSTPGGTFDATAASEAGDVGANGNPLVLWPTQLVQGWVDGTIPNDGLLLKQSAEDVANVLSYYSGSPSTPSMDLPNLQITYTPWDGIQRAQQAQTFSLDKWTTLYVNTANGNVGVQQKVLSISGTGLPLEISQDYNQVGQAWTDLGSGWSLDPSGVDVSLLIFGNGDVAYTAPSGYTVPFLVQSDGTYTAPAGVDATLVKHPSSPGVGASYDLTFLATGQTEHFDGDGYLISEYDSNGNTITLTNGAAGYTTSLTDTQGRTITYGYNQLGVISTITDSDGRTYQYGYNGSGNELLTYTDAGGGVTTYGYGTGGQLTQITDPDGHETTITYDGSGRASTVTQVTDNTTGAGYTWTFTYHPDSGDAGGYTVVTDPNNHDTTYHYDPLGRTTEVVDAAGNDVTRTYTADSNVHSSTDGRDNTTDYGYGDVGGLPAGAALTGFALPTGAQGTFSYTDSGFPLYPTAYTDPQGNTLDYGYDADGNLSSVTDGLSSDNEYSFTYNTNGTLASMTDAMGNVTTYGYDTAGNLTGVTPPSPLGQTAITYDDLSRVSTVTDGKDQETTYTYNDMDEVTEISYADASSVSYTYDDDGNVLTMEDGTGTTTYGYDALNRLTSKTLPSTAELSYAYDGVGNLTSATDGGGTVDYAYSPNNDLTTLTDPAQNETTYQYNADGQQTEIAYPNGVTMDLGYNTAGQLTSIVADNADAAVLTSSTYSYTNPATDAAAALRYSVTDASGATTAYSYDVLNRLTEAQTTSGGTVTADYQYAYDGNGNRTSQDANGTQTTYTYNAADEMTAAGDTTYSYDADGNETGNGAGLALTYNAANMTSSVTPPNASAIAMTYTGATQTQRVATGSTTYQNGPQGVASQTDSIGTTYYTRTPSGQLVSERTPDGTYYYLFDGQGSVVGLTDSGGSLVNTYTYDPYGNVTHQTGTTANPWLFTGTCFDVASGLYKMGARYYDPHIGRWLQVDPVGGDAGLPSSLAPFAFAGNDPVNVLDPSGTSWWTGVQIVVSYVCIQYGFFNLVLGVAIPVYGYGCLAWGVVELGYLIGTSGNQ